MPLSTWLLTGYFRGVPREREEQAMVAGATRRVPSDCLATVRP